MSFNLPQKLKSSTVKSGDVGVQGSRETVKPKTYIFLNSCEINQCNIL